MNTIRDIFIKNSNFEGLYMLSLVFSTCESCLLYMRCICSTKINTAILVQCLPHMFSITYNPPLPINKIDLIIRYIIKITRFFKAFKKIYNLAMSYDQSYRH